MICVSLRFSAGRFHATPWGHHVNEGSVEWPPSQWRFLRALISVWHLKCHESVGREQLRRIVHALSNLPELSLPPASSAGTRHYMPGNSHKEGVKRDMYLVLDTSVTVSPGDELLWLWRDASLSEEDTEALGTLLKSLSYFGRSESWVKASLTDYNGKRTNSIPLSGNEPESGTELVEVACTLSAGEYSAWREGYMAEAAEAATHAKQQKLYQKGKPTEGASLTKKELAKLEKSLPADLLEALEVSTADLRREGWSIPPGMRFIRYTRPGSSFSISPVNPPAETRRAKAVRYALSSRVLPSITDALSVGERARQYLMGMAGRRNEGRVPEVFSGKTAEGNPLKKNHAHAYYLSESNDSASEISHLSIYSRKGFSAEEIDVLLSLRGIWGRDGYDIKLIPLDAGDPEAFGGGMDKPGESPIFACSAVWESLTPFYPTRHMKNSKNTVSSLVNHYQDEVRKHLAYSGHPAPLKITVLSDRGIRLHGHLVPFNKFNTRRKVAGQRRVRMPAAAVRIEFEKPVRGPIALGYGCHFGLGAFIPVSTV